MKTALVFSVLLAACSSTPPSQVATRKLPSSAPRTIADEAFRKTPVIAPDPSTWTPPPVVERVLPSGLRVLVIERHDVPLVAIRIVSDRGADQADRGIPEMWSQSILRAGVGHPWYDVRDDVERMAIDWEAKVEPDSTTVELRVLSKVFVPAFTLISDLMVKPQVSGAELDRAMDRVHHQIGSADLKVAARRALGHVFYPLKHPYNEPFAPSENIPKVTTDLVLAYHASAFVAGHTTVAVAGDVDPEAVISTIASKLTLPTTKLGAVQPPPPPAALPEARFTIIDKKAASQAFVSAAWLAPTVGSEDEAGLAFARQILTNALYEDVRRDRGATYGLRITLPISRGTQLTHLDGFVQLDSVADAVKDVLADVEALGHDPPSPEVMQWARVGAMSRLTALFEGPESTAVALGWLAERNAKTSFFAERVDALRKTTADDVLRASRRWFSVDGIRFVVVGDADQLRPKLEALGVGSVKVRTPYLP